MIDINQGIEEQTLECINILKQYKTPFLIALNKLDLIPGWNSNLKTPLIQNIKNQSSRVQEELDKRLYAIVGKLSELELNSERFDRIDDFKKQVAIIPCSAKTQEGLPELLMIITGLAQRFLEESLRINVEGPGRAIILEVREEKGIGTILDTILYDGKLKVNDQIIIGNLPEPIITKIKAIFETNAKKNKSVKEVTAAASIHINAPETEKTIGGMPLIVANTNIEEAKESIKHELSEVLIETDKSGIIIKADTLGSLEALTFLLKEKGIKIKRASIGDITKKDIAECLSEKEVTHQIILGFNVRSPDIKEIKIITNNIIYKIIDDFESWKLTKEKELEAKQLESIQIPCKLKVLRGFVFRQSNPAVFGVSILSGRLKTNTELLRSDGSKASVVKEIQHERKSTNEVESRKDVAISVPNVTIGRQIKEDDILYSDLNEEEFLKLKELKKYLNASEIETLKEIASIKRKENPMWGI
ncbi:translation initiation factor IF-2 [Candidatus Woesearchaeota archaeon]|nr:translation initiation factor IF-2 [Candidatus Woesearchaeota archaeon]